MANHSVDMREICELYNKRLFHIAYSITRDHHLAQDVVQETYIKAYKKISSIKEKEKLGAWLSSIATRTAIDFIRKERRRSERIAGCMNLENVDVKMNQNVEQEVEMNLLKEQISLFLNSLSPDQKRVFFLKISKGLKEKEIAKILQLNPNTVKTKIYRVRKQLKEMLINRDSA